MGLGRSTHLCLKLNCPTSILSNKNEVRISAKHSSGELSDASPPHRDLYWGHIIQSEKKNQQKNPMGRSFPKINLIPF